MRHARTMILRRSDQLRHDLNQVGAPYVALGDAQADAEQAAVDAAYARTRLLDRCGQSAFAGLSWIALGLGLVIVAPLAYGAGKKAARA